MTAIDKKTLEAKIGPKADYYLRRFERIDAGRKAGWNWPAFFFSTVWFSYRGLTGYAALNLIAPWAAVFALAMAGASADMAVTPLLIAYPVVFFLVVPMYADVLYYRYLRKEIAREAEPGQRPSSSTRPFSATVVGLVAVVPVLLGVVAQGAYVDYIPRSQVSEAISLMGGAKTPLAEYRADKGKWPADLKDVAGNTSGKYTERVEITAGAGAASGPLTITATMKASGVNYSLQGKTVQMSSADGKEWNCRRGAVNGVEEKYLPAACR